jgi:hypothetical protein
LNQTQSNTQYLLVAAILLALFFGLAVGSSLPKAPTFDEGFYVARGWLYWQTGHLYRINHPPLLSEFSGLLLLTEPGLPDPSSLDGWEVGEDGVVNSNAQLVSQDFMWGHGLNVERVTFLARMTTIWLALLLGALVWRWARELYGAMAAPIALGLYALSPNVIAHGRLATLDLGVGAFYVAALYGWWRYLRRPSLLWMLVGGALLGLAEAAKFSAAMVVPTMAVLLVLEVDRGRALLPRGPGWLVALFERVAGWPGGKWLVAALGLGLTGLVALLALWATFLFEVRPYPLATYFQEAIDLAGLASGGFTNGYLRGQISPAGWWYYHPLAYIFKSPLPELLLVTGALIATRTERSLRREGFLLVSIAVYLVATILGNLNVGYRYLLPIVPLLHIYAGKAGARLWNGTRPWIGQSALAGLAVWLLIGTMAVYPDYLAYFNEAFGGPANGYKLLSDSNVDWGQDLPRLAGVLDEHGIDHVKLSYFGQADPAYYGIDYERLPGWPPPPPGEEDIAAFYPLNPEPGYYAISASNLVGVRIFDPNTFSWFRAHEPLAVVGHSIFVYEVPERPQPTWAAQCYLPTASVTEDLLAEASGNSDLRHLYVDCATGMAVPPGSGWLVVRDIPPPVDIGPPDFVEVLFSGAQGYSAYRLDEAPVPDLGPPAGQPTNVGEYIRLAGYSLEQDILSKDGETVLTVWWQVNEVPPPPFSFFAHMVKPDGTVYHTADGLAVPPEWWQPGDTIIQRHTFPLPPGDYPIHIGMYSLVNGERFPVVLDGEEAGDAIVLPTVSLP